MDQHVPAAITEGLRSRGVDVLTAFEDDHADANDPVLLARATSLGRIVFTRDRDFLAIGRAAQSSGAAFSGIVYAHQLQVTIGQAIRDLELICQLIAPDESKQSAFLSRVQFGASTGSLSPTGLL